MSTATHDRTSAQTEPRRETTPARKAPRWTAAEDAVIRSCLVASPRSRRFVPRDWPAILRALPGRTKRAVTHRAHGLGATRKRRWTAAETATLCAHMGEDGRRTIEAKLPGRSWRAISEHARRLGIKTFPQGWVTLKKAATRSGFDMATLRGVLAWARVNGLEVAERKHTTTIRVGRGFRRHSGPKRRARVGPTLRWTLVQMDEVEASVAAWSKTELLAVAARRLGLDPSMFRKWARDAGLLAGRRAYTRRDPAVYDALARAHGRLA